MKLRIRGNSLRLRLTRGEVEAFRQSGRVDDSIRFAPGAGGAVHYTLEVAPRAAAVAAVLKDQRITVSVPPALAQDWLETERVGFEAEQAIGEPEPLRILVEKDFACLKPREDEDDSDAYPNPQARG